MRHAVAGPWRAEDLDQKGDDPKGRTDGCAARSQTGQGEWAPSEGVLMTVEVTSYDHDTDRRDHYEKPHGYAAAGIPVYLLIDRESDTLLVHSEPDKGRYRQQHSYDHGDAVTLPHPVSITLGTEELKDYVRRPAAPTTTRTAASNASSLRTARHWS
ncbi:Uma2 family endonuclease [Streptomyces parvus]|uniref:Uma2 family endonuclease n=1 Tax=Streptomyces parvus TaxID=66428 RepID=UPI00363E09A9